jgi:hypothetical protein
MFRKISVYVSLAATLLAVVLAVSLFLFQHVAKSAPGNIPQSASLASPAEQTGTSGTYFWSYAAKFVCGYQDPLINANGYIPGEPVVKPGNYATDITMHNPVFKGVHILKNITLLVEPDPAGGQIVRREPDTAPASHWAYVDLGVLASTMDDCNAIYKMINSSFPSTRIALITGYLVIYSETDLDVDVTYTASEPGDVTLPPVSISENVLRVTGKRVFMPSIKP